MKCPFCGQEVEPVETASGNRVEYHCPQCRSLVAAYLKGMEQTLKSLVSIERFKSGAR